MEVSIRRAVAADVAACGQILYEAFKGINERHGFENDEIPTAAVGRLCADFCIRNPFFYGVVAEAEGRIIGSCFLDERSAIRGVDVISVDPIVQGQGVGRKLMEAVLERSRGARGVRLAQHTFNISSVALYASLGFEVKELLLLMRGRPSSKPTGDVEVRRMDSQDLDACGALCREIHGFERNNELRDALQTFTPFVACRAGRIVAYASAFGAWSANHGVAETENDMRALLLGVAVKMEPLCFLLPARQASFLRWCLEQGLRVVKPMTLMAKGEYQEPVGCYFTSVLF